MPAVAWLAPCRSRGLPSPDHQATRPAGTGAGLASRRGDAAGWSSSEIGRRPHPSKRRRRPNKVAQDITPFESPVKRPGPLL